MISEQTIINIIDNSGAIEGRCIKILIPKSSRGHRSAGVGDVIILSVTKTIPGSKIKKGDILKALIVRTKKDSNRLKPVKKGHKYLITENSSEEKAKIWVPGKKTNKTGYSLSFGDNSVVLVKAGGKNVASDLTPIGSRIRGPLCDSLKINVRNGCKKLIAIS